MCPLPHPRIRRPHPPLRPRPRPPQRNSPPMEVSTSARARGQIQYPASNILRPSSHASRFTFHVSRFTFHGTRTTHHAPRIASACAAVCLLLTGCLRPDPPADLVIINGTEPESLDPAIIVGIPEMRLTKALFEGLVRLDPKEAKPIPALAERWDVSPDGKVYTFYLRTNAAWSTGQP